MAFNGIKKDRGLTTGNITLGLLWFAVPMILGNLLQQFYNIADTLIVGQFLGANALAAVGSAYSLMIFLTSVLLGLCMGSGAIFSLQYGAGDREALKRSIFVSLVLIGLVTLVLNVAVFVWIDPILRLLQVPEAVYPLMRDYLWVIFWGIGFTFIYNYYASLLRAIGNSIVPLWFLGVAVVLNIALDSGFWPCGLCPLVFKTAYPCPSVCRVYLWRRGRGGYHVLIKHDPYIALSQLGGE